MNKTLLAMAATVLLAACGGGNKYTISGTIDDDAFDGKKVYLTPYFNYGGEVVDSAVVEGRRFVFQGTVDTPYVAEIQTQRVDDNSLRISFVLEPGDITLVITHHDETDSVAGTPANEAMHRVNRGEGDILARTINNPDDTLLARKRQIDSLYSTTTVTDSGIFVDMRLPKGITLDEYDRLEKHADEIDGKFFDESRIFYWQVYNENKASAVGEYAMKNLLMLEGRMEGLAFVDSVYREAPPAIQKLLEDALSEAQLRDKTSAGKPYIDLGGVVKTFENGQWKERDGSLKSLIDGKLALIDFWASWCGPCCEEIEKTLLAIDRKYRPQGLVVVGIDVWDKPEAHARAAAQLGITYPQLLDTTPDTRNEERFTKYYGINGIPEILLIAPDGTILARGIRGEEIEPAVLKALQEMKK